jgi:hypothetical protein
MGRKLYIQGLMINIRVRCLNTANDFRARLRFTRAVGEPPRLRVRVRKAEGLGQRRLA